MRWSVVVVMLLGAGLASAQPASPQAKRAAATHRKQAKAHIARGKLDLAIRELELSVERVADPAVLFELAGLYERLPDEAKAFATYQRITDGKHAAEAQGRIAAITAERERREAEAKAAAEAEAKAKAEEDARRKAAEAAVAARKADEERRRAELAERKRHSAALDALEKMTRATAEERHRSAGAGAARADHERTRDLRRDRRVRGVRYLKLGIASGLVAGAATAFGAWQTSRVEEGGFATASDISFALTTGKVANYTAYAFGIPAAIGVAAGVTLIILGREPGDVRLSAVSTGSLHGFAISGTLP